MQQHNYLAMAELKQKALDFLVASPYSSHLSNLAASLCSEILVPGPSLHSLVSNWLASRILIQGLL